MWSRYSMAVVAVALSTAMLGCDKKSNVCPNGASAEFSGNHGHALTIPADAVQRGMGGTFAAKGDATHEHVVVLKDADMKKLGEGQTVKTRTSSANAHVHEVEIKCN